MIDCNLWKTEKRHECANMGKVKRLELWWQLYRTSLPVRDLEIPCRWIFVRQGVPIKMVWIKHCASTLGRFGEKQLLKVTGETQDTSIDKVQSNTPFNICIARTFFYIACLNTLRTGAFKFFKCTFPGSKQFKSCFILCFFKYL